MSADMQTLRARLASLAHHASHHPGWTFDANALTDALDELEALRADARKAIRIAYAVSLEGQTLEAGAARC